MPSPNSSLLVVGGTYGERCAFPRYDEIYGSGLRAASALASGELRVCFHTVATPEFERHIKLKAAAFGFAAEVVRSDRGHRFWYQHTLAGGELTPESSSNPVALKVEGECVLQFGMVEADVIATASTLIYDPQSPAQPKPLHRTGSSGKRVAIVLNSREATALAPREGLAESAREIRRAESAEVVVVKDGPRGALVCTEHGETWVPVFVTPSCFLIGSGDIFSAVFAREWGVKQVDVINAATAASLATASWCSTRVLPLCERPTEISASARPIGRLTIAPRLYLAGPFFCASQLWWVAHSRRVLTELGFSVFSPYHEIGVANLENAEIAKQDIEALKNCDIVFALLDGLDPGTLFEIGVARTHGVPVVGLRTEGSLGLHETMLQGTGCALFDDFGSAAYHAYWSATARAKL